MRPFLAITGCTGLAVGLTALSLSTGSDWSYRYIAMPLVRLMDPERAHRVAVRFANWAPSTHMEDDRILVRIMWCYPRIYPRFSPRILKFGVCHFQIQSVWQPVSINTARHTLGCLKLVLGSLKLEVSLQTRSLGTPAHGFLDLTRTKPSSIGLHVIIGSHGNMIPIGH